MLQVNNVSFQYTEGKPTLTNITLTLNKGEHLCVMGESGCGKSTLLKLIYGLLDVNEGNLFWDDIQILGPAFHLVPGVDEFKYVAQDFDLMPFRTVVENIAKFLSRFHPEETKRRTEELMEVIEMTAFANVKVKNLSGGQQQRVAIARALAREPELLLLDEPFNQIDNFKKNTLRRRLFAYLKDHNIACIVATHDGNDALSFADKMLVIKEQKIIANAIPQELYKNPKSKYIASLFDDVNEILIFNKKILLYPHQIEVSKQSVFKAQIINSYFKGFYWLVEAIFEAQVVLFFHETRLKKGTEVSLNFKERLE